MSYSSEAIAETNNLSAQVQQIDARKTELAAFEKATNGLIDNKEKGHNNQDFSDAIDLNCKLFNALEKDLGKKENQLPDDLKAKLISVAMWVERHSVLVKAGNAKVDSLIEVNQSIMTGLESQSK